MTTKPRAIEQFPYVNPIAFFLGLWQARRSPLTWLIVRRLRIHAVILFVFYFLLMLGLYLIVRSIRNVPFGPGGFPRLVILLAYTVSALSILIYCVLIPIIYPIAAWKRTLGADITLRLVPQTPSEYVYAFLAPAAASIVILSAIGMLSALFAQLDSFAREADGLASLLMTLFEQVVGLIGVIAIISAFILRVLSLRRFAGSTEGRGWFSIVKMLIVLILVVVIFELLISLLMTILPRGPLSVYGIVHTIAQALLLYSISYLFWCRDFEILEFHTFAAREAA
ncbi:hypothetical protein KQI84_16760 [bacterium]|nr:hypothetical protein [bacterium]